MRIVTDDSQTRSIRAKMLKDLRLQQVGVLVLVDKDTIKLLSNRPCSGFVGNQRVPEEQEVVVVQAVQSVFAFDVPFEELLQFFFKVDTPGKDLFQNNLQLRS